MRSFHFELAEALKKTMGDLDTRPKGHYHRGFGTKRRAQSVSISVEAEPHHELLRTAWHHTTRAVRIFGEVHSSADANSPRTHAGAGAGHKRSE